MIINELFSEYNTYNPFTLAKKLGIKVRYMPLPERIKGKYQPCVRNEYILINDELWETPEEYFVCAHELFHAIEHQGAEAYYLLNSRTYSQIEHEANEFAVKLMINFSEDLYENETIYHYMDRLGISKENEYIVNRLI